MRKRFAALTLAIALTSGTSPAGAGWEIDHCWGELGTEPGEFLSAFGIAVDDDGLVYVTDFGRDNIQVFGADGEYLATWSTGSAPGMEFDTPVGLEFEDDRLYVMNRGLCKLHVMGTDCSVLGEWWSCGLLQWGHRIAVGAGLVCMEINGASGGLRVFDRAGTHLFDIDGLISGVEIGPVGDIWVTVYEPPQIAHYSSGGEFIEAFSVIPPWADWAEPVDLAFDTDSSIVVANGTWGSLERFSTSGEHLESINATNEPLSLVVAGDVMYTSNFLTPMVCKFVRRVVPVESTSWGAIKAMYRGEGRR